jgi:hypothetical protein
MHDEWYVIPKTKEIKRIQVDGKGAVVGAPIRIQQLKIEIRALRTLIDDITNARKAHLMGFAKTEREWAERTARHLKAELKRADLTYEDLAEKLEKHGFRESKASIASKLSRATVTASFFLASLAAIGCEAINLQDI